MDKSKMKEIRKQVRNAELDNAAAIAAQTDAELDNAAQMNKQERIYEKSSDGTVRSRKPLDYGNEKIEEYSTKPHCIGPDGVEHNKHHTVRKEVLNELWTSDKVLKDGYWYIKLSDVIKIIGDYNELYENESRS
tara:strand:- start:1013 stop:1414 length:402 start_codon:yes stop_codon:yes gene_type:complete